MYSNADEAADGPAVKCPGHTPETRCEDYPDGSCTRCIAAADEEVARIRRLDRRAGRDVNWALIAGAGPKPASPPKPNPAPNGPWPKRGKTPWTK